MSSDAIDRISKIPLWGEAIRNLLPRFTDDSAQGFPDNDNFPLDNPNQLITSPTSPVPERPT